MSHSWGAWYGVLAVAVVSTLLRIPDLSEPAVWFDESFSMKMASFSVGEIWQRSGEDTHPPAYFLLLKAWTALFGSTVSASRALSVLLGTGTSILTVLFVRIAYAKVEPNNERESRPLFAACVAGLLVAVNPLQIAWSMQVRMYVLLAFLAMLTSCLLVKALQSRDKWAWWAAYAIGASLLTYTHLFGVVATAAQFLYATAIRLRTSLQKPRSTVWMSLRPTVLAAVAVAIAWAPWLSTVAGQQSRVANDYWTKPLDWTWFGRAFWGMVLTWKGGDWTPTAGLWAAQGFVLLLLGLLLGRRRWDGLVVLSVLLPFAFAILVSLTMRNIMVDRYFIAANVFLSVALAVVLSRVSDSVVRWSATITVVVAMSLCCREYWLIRQARSIHPGMREVLRRFDESNGDGELLVVCNPMLHTSAIIYARNDELVRTWGSANRYPFYHGTAVMRPAEYFGGDQLAAYEADWLWALDSGQWADKVEKVPVPAGWELVSEIAVREWYCDLILRMYRRTTHRPPEM